LIKNMHPVDKNSIFLALDFDGVLHHAALSPSGKMCEELVLGKIDFQEFSARASHRVPQECGRFFDHCDLLVDAIERSESDVRLVIATAWRNVIPENQLKKLIPKQLARWVVGSLERCDGEGYWPGTRASLMHSWMEKHAPAATWFALDDQGFHYGTGKRLPIWSNAGIDRTFADQLSAALAEGQSGVERWIREENEALTARIFGDFSWEMPVFKKNPDRGLTIPQ
jgi:HAD domain in Swiss Army Knife RNA repair proteins